MHGDARRRGSRRQGRTAAALDSSSWQRHSARDAATARRRRRVAGSRPCVGGSTTHRTGPVRVRHPACSRGRVLVSVARWRTGLCLLGGGASWHGTSFSDWAAGGSWRYACNFVGELNRWEHCLLLLTELKWVWFFLFVILCSQKSFYVYVYVSRIWIQPTCGFRFWFNLGLDLEILFPTWPRRNRWLGWLDGWNFGVLVLGID
jgi:hypothetical protein